MGRLNILVVELKYELVSERRDAWVSGSIIWAVPITGLGKTWEENTLFKKEAEVRPGNLGTRFWAAKYELCIGTYKGRCQLEIRGKIWAENCTLET